MLESIQHRFRTVQRRVRRFERRETREVRRWLEDTDNLVHLSVLVIVPVLLGAVTWLSNASPVVSFLLYPPLASGTYTLFADPNGRYSSPRTFVGGMTLGAFSGWVALELSAMFWYSVPPEQFHVHAGAAALGIFLTAVATWVTDLEVPTAFSSALLVLVTGSEQLTYVGGIAVSSLLVAGVFVLWRRHFYHERARYLFRSTRGDDQILVPLRGDHRTSLALFAARLAAAHETGKIVLMESVKPEVIDETRASLEVDELTEDGAGTGDEDEDVTRVAEELVTEPLLERLETLQARVEREVDINCEFVVAVEEGTAGETVLRTAADENCDLIVAPYETEDDELTAFVRTVLSGDTDAIVFRPANGRTEWHRILVMVRTPGDLANAMLDFAHRLVDRAGTVSACTCISRPRERRRAEVMLEGLVESFSSPVETRIGHGAAEEFLETNAPLYHLAVVGASTDRSAASRFFSLPTFERIRDVDCDLAIVHRGRG